MFYLELHRFSFNYPGTLLQCLLSEFWLDHMWYLSSYNSSIWSSWYDRMIYLEYHKSILLEDMVEFPELSIFVGIFKPR